PVIPVSRHHYRRARQHDAPAQIVDAFRLAQNQHVDYQHVTQEHCGGIPRVLFAVVGQAVPPAEPPGLRSKDMATPLPTHEWPAVTRTFRADWVLLGLITLVCLTLSLLQWRWTGEFARAESVRLRAVLSDQTQRMAQA